MYSLDLCITDRCNQRCPHCYVDPRNSSDDLTTQQILDLLTECSELGAQNFHVFGGEPFLRDDLEEIFTYANDLNLTLSVATNGTRLNQNFEWIQRLNPFVGITLHGPKEFHDSFCKQEGSYETALSALKTALQMNLNAGVVTCVTQLNIKSYLSWMESLVELGVQTFFILYFSPLGRGKDLKNAQLSNDEWNSLYQTLNEFILNSKQAINIYFERAIVPITNALFSGNYLPCSIYSKMNCVADANGDVYPCILFLRNPDFRLGNFKINSLHEIWERLNPEYWYTWLKKTSKCNECMHLRTCVKGCPAYYVEGLDFRCDDKNIPICPLYTQQL